MGNFADWPEYILLVTTKNKFIYDKGVCNSLAHTGATSKKVVVLGGTYQMREGGVKGLPTTFGSKIGCQLDSVMLTFCTNT